MGFHRGLIFPQALWKTCLQQGAETQLACSNSGLHIF